MNRDLRGRFVDLSLPALPANAEHATRGGLIKRYDTTTDPSMKETLIGISIRNGERASIDKLVSIVKGEENLALRRRTVSRLASSEDPRIKQALADLVIR